MSGNSTTQSEPWTILRLLQWTTDHLKRHGSTSPRLDAEVLLANARGCQRIDLYTAFSEEPDESVKAAFREMIKRRAAGEPVAYLVGKKEFYSLSFRVSKDCLIPRGETEHLVVECLDRAKKLDRVHEPIRIADVCTGSGCIAVSIAKHLKQADVTAIDLSCEAIEIAKSNVRDHGLEDRVHVVLGDLLEPVPASSLDFVCSNPPYVSEAEFEQLDRSVREHEPRMALVSGLNGTEMIGRLAEQAVEKLLPGGWFICEFSPMIADSVTESLIASHRWSNVSCVRDLAGQKRLVIAQKPLS
jgi:release factor glutamine methyltransferase